MKTVWMLGAGFSKQGGYPVVSDFLDPSFYMHRLVREELRGWSQMQAKAMMPEVEKWSRLDSDLNRLMSFFIDRRDTANTRGLNRFIMKTLDMVTDYIRDDPTLPFLEAFVGQIGASDSSIISFNYDTLIEEMLCLLNVCQYHDNDGEWPLNPTYDLGIDSNTCKSRFDSKGFMDYGSGYLPYKLPTKGPIKILKLHGSTCLRYCQNCLNLIYNPPYSEPDPSINEHCPHCTEKTNQDLLFVPPASDKNTPIWNFLAPVWRKAEHELMSAQNLIIIGYSLPQEDKTARDLLASVALKNPGLRVLVIDPFMSDAMCARFRQVFPKAIFVKESCKGLMDILITLRTKHSGSISNMLSPEAYSVLIDLVSPKSLRKEGVLSGTLPLGEDPLAFICKDNESEGFKSRVIYMLGMCRLPVIRETLFEQATSADIAYHTRASIAFALSGVTDQKTVDWLNELLLETIPIEVPEWPLPNTISDFARSGLLQILFSDPSLNFNDSLLYLCLLISHNQLMEHHKIRAISAVRALNSLPILRNKYLSDACFGIVREKTKKKAYALRKSPRIFQDNEISEMIKEKGFYDKYENPEGKGIEHDYTAPFINGDWVVVDYVSGLMWSLAQASLVPYSGSTSLIRYLKKRRYGGYNDWRLPTLEEALSLLKPPTTDGFCEDPIFLRRLDRIWTSDRDECPYVVHLFQGYCSPCWTIDHADAFVRAVRNIDGFNLSSWIKRICRPA